MSAPWLKFYCADWRADPRLRMCSLSARGLWIDLLSYMQEGAPYGHLTIDGRIPDIDDIAALVARPRAEVRKALGELEANNVFSRAEGGAIYSRRMVRDKAKADRDRENGKGGGNPKIKGEVKEGVNPPVNGGDKAQIPDTRSQNLEREDTSLRSDADKYAFESGVIRLNKKDFDNWQQSFSYLDLRAELLSLSPWAADQPKWFHAVQGALAKRNREQKIKTDQARAQGAGQPQRGIPGII